MLQSVCSNLSFTHVVIMFSLLYIAIALKGPISKKSRFLSVIPNLSKTDTLGL